MIVVRRFLSDSRCLEFHTDLRSPKVAELRHDPRIVFVYYDPETRIQMRVTGRAEVHANDDRAREAWKLVPPVNRALFMVPFQPSVELPDGVDLDHMPVPDPTDDSGFDHFAAVACTFSEVDILWLRAEGHLRSRLVWSNGGWQLVRLCP
jgi:hypothetical protein